MTLLRRTRSSVRVLLAAAIPASAFAQTPPAVAHPLGPVLATSAATFGNNAQLVTLSDGRVMVSDQMRRMVSLFDASFGSPTVVLDSVSGKWTSFGAAAGGSYLARFLGDSALWYDGTARAFVIIQPDGSLGRVVAPPSYTTPFPSTLVFLTSWVQHGLLYRVNPTGAPARLQQLFGSAPIASDTVITRDDSVTVVRMNFATRAMDSVARIATGRLLTLTLTAGRPTQSMPPALFPFVDEVVSMSDGYIGVFRAREYRIDWIAPDGTRTRGARLPYPWRRITDDMRQAMIDTINHGQRAFYDTLMAQRAADSARTGAAPTMTITTINNGVATTRKVPAPVPQMPKLFNLDQVPDYFPPVGSGTAAMADADGHMWLGTVANDALPAGTECGAVVTERGFSVWDVVSRTAGVIDRVRIPNNRTVAGFGPGGVVYLRYFVGGGQWRFDKVQIAEVSGAAAADSAARRPAAGAATAGGGRGSMGRRFAIAPAIDGKAVWDLDVDGPLDIGAPGTWTITPQGGFTAAAHLWGGGGGGPFSDVGRGGGGGYSTGSITFENAKPYTLVVGGGGQGALKAGCGANGGHGGGGAGGGVQAGGEGNAGLPFAAGGRGRQGQGAGIGAAGGGGGLSGLFSGASATQAGALLIAGGGGGATYGAVSGGGGGGATGEDGSGTLPGRGGSASAAGKLAPAAVPAPGSTAPTSASITVGRGGRVGGPGGGGAPAVDNSGGGAGFGGGGPFATGGGAGGGGGGGYFGGSSGGQNRGGGGGGSGYVAPSVGRGSTASGRGAEAGNAKDAGNGGAGAGAGMEGSPGAPGRIIIR